ncbi:7-carboxy-7-deazaguanine synthase QueE, partial [Flavobacteriaceae bacterium (ex Bugula neritina AB1)]
MQKSIEKLVNEGKMLPLMEEFYTIQGEGFHKGTAAYFVRIGGCDVGCHWCDVKESWNADIHPPTATEVIVDNAIKHSDVVVVTGGEPLTWDMDILTKGLKDKGVKTHIETSGAYKLSGEWDWICLSPKKMKLPTEEIYRKAHMVYCIVY